LRRAILAGAAVLVCTAVPLVATGPAAAGGSGTADQICRSWTEHQKIAAKMSRAIRDALRDRRHETPVVAVRVDDPSMGISCWLNTRRHFDSASVVKTIILAALLRKAHAHHRWLTRSERALAWRMITESDNDAATALWNDVGMYRLHRFLHLAGMGETKLSPAWGLTRITARDETILLQHLLLPNPVLTTKARRYELWLMAHVIRSQRWGVPAGAPDSFTVHVKNGWAPLPFAGSPWWVNSIGCFTHPGKDYTVVVLTEGNADAATGIRTIEDVAFRINRDLNPGTRAIVPYSTPNPSWTRPD
jgi:beta-lactamase class A